MPDGDGDVFAVTVQTYLASTGEVILVERMRMEDALRELKLQNTDLIDSRTAKRLGEMVGAAYVLVGESNEVPGNRLQVNARLVEVATAKQVPRVAGQCTVDPNDFDTFKPALQRLADELLVGMRAAGISMRRGVPPPTTGSTIVSPTPADSDWLGMRVVHSDSPEVQDLGVDTDTGVVVVEVRRGGLADHASLRRGDIVWQVGRAEVSTPAEFRSLTDAAKEAGKQVVLLVKNSSGARIVSIKPEE